jgi:predicted small lipoprotein YifL
MSLRNAFIPLALLAASLAGCASEGPPPREEMARAHTLVDQADKANGQRYAAADLQRAHDELSNAEREYGAQKFDAARADAESAAADADLASARAAAGDAQHAATEVARGNDSLRQEAARQPATDTVIPPPK